MPPSFAKRFGHLPSMKVERVALRILIREKIKEKRLSFF